MQFDARVHGALYAVEHGLDGTFEARVAQGLAGAALRGWPGPREGAWLVVDDERLAGGIGLTDEGGDVGRVRWFLLAPVLRGHGLGRQLLDGLVDHARAHDLRRLELETFGALRAAAHLYTGAGFVLTDAERRVCWGRQIELRHYALDLG